MAHSAGLAAQGQESIKGSAVRSAIRGTLADNPTLEALLPGGIYDDKREISRAGTPAAFDDNSELMPCLLIKSAFDSADGPDDIGSLAYMDLYLYERDGYSTIDQVLGLARQLLHRQKIGTDTDRIFEARWLNDVPGLEDGALLSSLTVSRYQLARYIG